MRNDIRTSLVSILSLLTACGSSDPIPGGTLPAPSSSAMPDPTSTGTPAPPSSGAPEAPCRAGFICDVQGMPFVRAALPSADSLGAPGDPPPGPGMTQVTIRQPEPGK